MPITEQDRQHLQLLSIFHYVVAVVAGLFSLLPVLHLVLGLAMVGEVAREGGDDAAIGLAMGWMFVVMAGLFIVAGLTYAVCLFLAGRFLGERSHYTFCLVMAAVSCIFVPIGTVLGVFTLIVLMRPPIRAAFEGAPEPAPPAG